MSHPINRGHRRFVRHVKGWRRLKEDRNQHVRDTSCPCFHEDDKHRFGKVFSRFADTPKVSSNCLCCVNPRKYQGPTQKELNHQRELREWAAYPEAVS